MHLAVLVCLCGLVQVVVVSRATVASIDAVRFVRIARQIDDAGFLHTVRCEGQQPLFPLAVCAVHGLMQLVTGQSPSLWATAAQTTAAVALVLAVVPVYFVARRMVGPSGGFIAGVFFCVLPEVSRLGADGISDSMHLLFFALAFWGALEYFRSDNHLPMLGAGVAVGLALLTRMESIVLLPAITATVVFCQLRKGATAGLSSSEYQKPSQKHRWTNRHSHHSFSSPLFQWAAKPLIAGGTLTLGLAIVLGPYLLAVGSTGPRDSALANAGLRILGRWHPPSLETPTAGASAADWLRPIDGNSAWETADGRRLVFGVKEPGASIRRRGYAAAARQFFVELADASGYVVGALSLLGLVHLWRLGRLRLQPSELLAATFTLLFALAAIRFTAAEGYMNARHLLLLVVVGISPSGVAAMALSHRIKGAVSSLKKLVALWCSHLGFTAFHPQARCPHHKKQSAAPLLGIVIFVVAICLITTLRPLHAGRIVHRQAGCWLATASQPGVVLDTKGWTDLYSARTTFQYDRAQDTFADKRLAYVVVQHADLESSSDRARTLRFLLNAAAEPAANFADDKGRLDDCNSVTIYRWHPERFRSLAPANPPQTTLLSSVTPDISKIKKNR